MHTTHSLQPRSLTTSAAPLRASLQWVGWTAFGRFWQQFKQHQRDLDQQRALGALSDRTLHDLGLAERAPSWRVDRQHWELDRWTR